MGTTAGGLPWPNGTDLVRDGDNAIRALAEALELRGNGLVMLANLVQPAPNGQGDFSFLWPSKPGGGSYFSAAPKVTITPGNSSSTGLLVVSVRDPFFVDTAGFTGNVMSIAPGRDPFPHTTPFWLSYIAIGPLG